MKENIFCYSSYYWLVWLFGFYGISSFVGYLMPNPFLYKWTVLDVHFFFVQCFHLCATHGNTAQLSSVSICCMQVFAGFSGCGNSIHDIIPLLKKNMYIYILVLKVIMIMWMHISNPPGKTWPWRWLCPL